MKKSQIDKSLIGKFINYKENDYSIQLYHKQNGDIVFYACYQDTLDLDKNGQAKRKRFKVGTKQEGITVTYAKRIRDEIVVGLRIGKIPDFLQPKTKQITFGDIYKRYMDQRESNAINENKHININKDKSIYNNYLSIFEHTNPNLIDLEAITKLKSNCLKKLAPKSVNNILTLLRSILNFAIENEIITKSPKIKLITGIDNQRERYFNNNEIKLILEHLKDNPILTMFIKLSLSTGGRLETIRNIKVKDINFLDSCIILLDLKGKNAGKNNATYYGFFNDAVKKELETFVKGLYPNNYIFSYDHKRRVSKDYIQNNLQNLFNSELDVKDSKNRAVVHTLRHTFATQLAASGVEIFTIQKLLNHSDITMTLRYAKFSPENGRNAINKLNLF